MKNTICITYNDEPLDDGLRIRWATVVDAEIGTRAEFTWNDNYEMLTEEADTDCEDFNDNARWLVKTLIAILKMEKQDPHAHADWSADFDHYEPTGKYRFNVEIKKVKDDE